MLLGVGIVGIMTLAFRWIAAELGDPLIATVGLAVFLIVIVATLQSTTSR